MSNPVRWLVAILMAVLLIVLIVGVGFVGVITLAFGSDSCSTWPDGVETVFFLAPVLMALGVVAGAVLFGLRKRWFWWLGALALGIFTYIAGFAWLTSAC